MAQSFFAHPPDKVRNALLANTPLAYANAPVEITQLELIVRSPRQLVEFYIEPDGQNVNPADLADDDTGLVATTRIFTMMDKFLGGAQRHSHAFVLSDAGMGKTSLLVLLKMAGITGLVDARFQVRLLKLGNTTEADILSIPNRSTTVLLLDAVDEDPIARENFYARVQHLLQLTENFQKTVITCRTQFFPEKHEKDPVVPGVVVLHGFRASLVFMSPFTDRQVDEYLDKKFTDPEQRTKAGLIAGRMKSLKFRPMLLAYIDLLLDRDDVLATPYEIFHALVDEWLNREQRKLDAPVKETLFSTCREIAMKMYRDGVERIDQSELFDMCQQLGVTRELDEMTIGGRSLLQKTSDLKYKFAHYSILEYFVAGTLSRDPERLKTTDQIKLFLLDLLRSTPLLSLKTLDLTRVRFEGLQKPSLNANSTDFSAAVFAGCDFHHGVLKDAILNGATFRECNLTGMNFIDAKMDKLKVTKCKLDASLWKGSIATNMEIEGCDLGSSNVDGTRWVDSHLKNCQFKNFTTTAADWTGCELQNVMFNDGVLNGCQFVGADLIGSTITGVNVQNCDFARAQLKNVRFIRSPLVDCTLLCAEVTGVVIEHGTLTRTTFSGAAGTHFEIADAKCEDAKFDGCEFRSPSFKSVECSTCTFAASELSGGIFNDCKFTGCDFTNTRGSSIQFENCDLSDGRLRGIVLLGAFFNKTNLSTADFRNAKLAGAVFREAVLTGTDFRDADLERADLSGHDLTKAKLAGCRLRSAKLSRTRLNSLTKVDLRNSTLREAILNGVTLDGMDLSGVDLTDASLVGVQLRRAQMKDCSVAGAKLKGATLEGANLANVNARGTDFSDAKIGGTLFHNVIYDDKTTLPPAISAHQTEGLVHESTLGTRSYEIISGDASPKK